MVFGDILTMFFSLLSVLVGFMYPAYSSYKAVEAKNSEAQARWLVYWAVFGLFSVTEVVLDVFLGRVTIYYIGKLSFLIWLQLPQTRVRTTNTYSAPIHTLKKKKKISMHAAALSMKSHIRTFPVDTLTCRHSLRWAYTEMIARSCSYRCRLRTLLTKKRLLNMYMILHVCVCVCVRSLNWDTCADLSYVCVCLRMYYTGRKQAVCGIHTTTGQETRNPN